MPKVKMKRVVKFYADDQLYTDLGLVANANDMHMAEFIRIAVRREIERRQA